jgi:hypothetical protein
MGDREAETIAHRETVRFGRAIDVVDRARRLAGEAC